MKTFKKLQLRYGNCLAKEGIYFYHILKLFLLHLYWPSWHAFCEFGEIQSSSFLYRHTERVFVIFLISENPKTESSKILNFFNHHYTFSKL